MMDWGSGWGIVGWLGMGLMMFSIWVVPIALVVWLVVRSSRNNQVTAATQPYSSPDDVLAERFARGEIDEDEYRQRLETLRGNARPVART